jgi:hypothetical protein
MRCCNREARLLRPASTWKLKFALFTSTYGDYFQTMDIPLLDGRTFTMHGRDGTPAVVIVIESMAKQNWPGQSAIGKRMHAGNPHKPMPWATVVGVVADTKVGAVMRPIKNSGTSQRCSRQRQRVRYGWTADQGDTRICHSPSNAPA